MSLAIKYEALADANLRLANTVVLYKNEPVYIHKVAAGRGDDIYRVRFDKLPYAGKIDKPRRYHLDDNDNLGEEPEPERKYISSKYFDIAPFKMGYMNDDALGAIYCSRIPGRIQQQGLNGENFRGRSVQAGMINFNYFLKAKGTKDMIAGKYPSFQEALELVNKKKASVAFSREFAVVNGLDIPGIVTLHHKGVKVGAVVNDRVILGTQYRCLKEVLNEMNIRVGD